MKNIINIINFIIFFYTVSVFSSGCQGLNMQNSDDLSVRAKEEGVVDVVHSPYSGVFCDEEKSVLNKINNDSLSKKYDYHVFPVSCVRQFCYNKKHIWFESDVSPPHCFFNRNLLFTDI